MPGYRIRQATVADVDAIVRHRVRMFMDMGELEPGDAPAVESATRARLGVELVSGQYVAWLVEAGNEVVAGAGVLLHQYYPNAENPRGRPTAYILNVYTEPEHRRQGLAQKLVEEILAWCRANDFPRASLHASDAGRAVYEGLGFKPSNEMRVSINQRSQTSQGERQA
jgi:GNAT superfamily N-acetyltransferase